MQCHYHCTALLSLCRQSSGVLAELFGFQMYGKLKPILALVSNEEEHFSSDVGVSVL